MEQRRQAPDHIEVHGARVHNLKNVNVDVPLNQLVGVCGVSGSGKSSLALGTLYAEGSRRYLEALSTYARNRLAKAAHADVDDVLYVPAALALQQRPAPPSMRSTFGTSTELLNSLRLLFSRCASHVCPNGHRCAPTLNVAQERPVHCEECGTDFWAPSAEELSFNSDGACPVCHGTGVHRSVDEAKLVPDPSKTIEEGAVAPWNQLQWTIMKQVAREMGVRTDVPFSELTEQERDIVFHGPAEKRHIFHQSKSSDNVAELDFTYINAVKTVENALSRAKDEKALARVGRFLKEEECPACHGTRLSEAARAPQIEGLNLADVCRMPLSQLCAWVESVPGTLPETMRPMARAICESFDSASRRLRDLGLSYLSLDRSSASLSNGERQRAQLARAVRNRTTGVLYVLDEPSIGLHPANLAGLLGVFQDLLADGNSVVMVDHDPAVLRAADQLIELGPGAGANGGRLIFQGTVAESEQSPSSLMGPYLAGRVDVRERPVLSEEQVFSDGAVSLETRPLHTVHELSAQVPKGRMTCVTGVSGSGKTTLVLEELLPAIEAAAAGKPLPAAVASLRADGLRRAELIDATPIGANVRSTVATYSGVLDLLRRSYAKAPEAKAHHWGVGAFSYNTGELRCPLCDGTGEIDLDVQFLPDVRIECPECHGTRYSPKANEVPLPLPHGGQGPSLPALMGMTVDEAKEATRGLTGVQRKLSQLQELGLGYLHLGEGTPELSGGEAQRLKLASELGRPQEDALFAFDEPSIGLHPLDVKRLLAVFDKLTEAGATLVVIEHDLELIANADWVIDLGPGGGEEGGRIVAEGTPWQVAKDPRSITGRYLAPVLAQGH